MNKKIYATTSTSRFDDYNLVFEKVGFLTFGSYFRY